MWLVKFIMFAIYPASFEHGEWISNIVAREIFFGVRSSCKAYAPELAMRSLLFGMCFEICLGCVMCQSNYVEV